VTIEPAKRIDPPPPRMRGRLHQIAFFVAIPAGVALVAAARTRVARLSAVVFALSLAGMYGVSGSYHRLPWSPRSLAWLKRVDHSMIFVLIAGTYTPFSLLVLKGPWAIGILLAAWVGAVAGVVMKFVRIDGLQAVGGALYITLGWLAIVATPQIIRGLSGPGIGLLLAGGLLYTAGAIALATKRPNPVPGVFGYHEVWHGFTVAAGACHYAMILLLLLR
jgi:hemolysin III